MMMEMMMNNSHALAASAPATAMPSPLPQYSRFAPPTASPSLPGHPPAPAPLRTVPPAAGPAPKVRQGFIRDHTIFGPLLPPRVARGAQAGGPSRPPISGAEAKALKFFDKWTSKVGLAKIGALVGLTGLAGVGCYFSVHAILAAVAAGAGAKVGAILIPVGIGIAAALVVVVLGRLVYKSWKRMRENIEANRERLA